MHFLSGYVPHHNFTYGKTYKEGTEASIAQFKLQSMKGQAAKDELTDTVRSLSKLQVSEDYPPLDPTHPGVNVRYAYANYGKYFGKASYGSY